MRAVVLTVWVFCLLLVQPAQADDTTEAEAEARVLFREGNRLLDKRDLLGALDMYRAAFRRYPNAKILLNTAGVLVELRRKAEAADTYERYLADPAADPKIMPKVAQIVAELEKEIGRLRIEVGEPGARMWLDGKEVGESPQALLVRVDPGAHTLMAVKEGFASSVATVTVGRGDLRTVVLRLERPDLPPVAGSSVVVLAPAKPAQDQPESSSSSSEVVHVESPPENNSQPTERASDKRQLLDGSSIVPSSAVTVDSVAVATSGSQSRRVIGLAMAGTGAALVATGVYCGLRASSAYADVTDLSDTKGKWIDSYQETYERGDRDKLVAIVTIAIGSSSAIAGGILYYLGRSERHFPAAEIAVMPVAGGAAMIVGGTLP
ncbi:MAG: PEGA domain-containing protein [Pseudomonadota bacterium]